MDRGRVGTLAIGNKTIRDQMIAHQQAVHMERISKIKNRKPGSSNTLDNTAPVIVKAALVNPRKIAKKKEFNEMTERENRVLLQRISNTLTGPPKITTADYDRMRKIVVNLKGGRALYEEGIRARHHRRYLDHLKKMGPYYDPKEWELDYKRQKVQQMFMREVPYERPKDYVTKVGPRFITLGTIHDKDDFKPHHTQIKGFKHELPPNKGKKGGRARSAGQINRIKNITDASSRDSTRASSSHRKRVDENDGDEYGDEEFDNEAGPRPEDLLACTHRYIKVIDEDIGDPENEEEMQDRWGEVTCYAVDETLVITGNLKAEDGKSAHAAEAEIDIRGLADIRGLDGDMIVANKNEMRKLAKYVSEGVDMRVSEGVARIILNLADDDEGDGEGEEGGSGDPSSPKSKKERASSMKLSAAEGQVAEGSVESKAYDSDWNSQVGADNSVEFENSFMGEDVFTSTYNDLTAEVVQIGIAKNKRQKKQQPDSVQLDAVVSCEVDQITIQAEVTSSSSTKFKENPAVKVGEKFTLSAILPSIMSADIYLMKEYFFNLVQNIIIETHHMNGTNKAFLSSE